MVNSAYFVKSAPPRGFSVSFYCMVGVFIDILKMCMNNFNAKKIILTNLQGFHLHITVSLACSQFLVLLILLK